MVGCLDRGLVHVERVQDSDVTAPWPYPLLCLCWRLGWGGRRLLDHRGPGARPDRQRAGAAVPPASDGTTVSADPEPSHDDDVDATPAPSDAEAPTGVPMARRVHAILLNSPLMPPSGTVAASEALAATVALICPPTVGRGDLTTPAFWRQTLGTWPGYRTPCVVPSPRPRWDPATWTLVAILEGAWDTTGTTFLGRERPALFQVAGTRRMAARHGWSVRRALACGRTAHRIWRHWFETREAPRLAQLAGWPVPPRLRGPLLDMATAYRRMRAAQRTGQWTPDLDALPAACWAVLAHLAASSTRELRAPVVSVRPAGLRLAVARALLVSPLGRVAAHSGVTAEALRAAAEQTVARLLSMLTAPWPWAPRPVVRGPRRIRQEARARATRR
jgi:hypothetical protein